MAADGERSTSGDVRSLPPEDDAASYPRRSYAWSVVAILIGTAILSYTDRQVLSLLIEAMPDYAEEYRQRGIVHMRLGNHRAAKEDLETYLRLEPNAPEREDVKKQLVLIERWKAGMN